MQRPVGAANNDHAVDLFRFSGSELKAYRPSPGMGHHGYAAETRQLAYGVDHDAELLRDRCSTKLLARSFVLLP
jgi:hypothetical protein